MDLVGGFESCTLPAAEFHHRQHIEVAWTYLREAPVDQALARFTAALKRFAAANGVPNLYHETITWAFILLINERMERGGRETGFAEFEAANPDLFEKSCLGSYYREETLASELARRVFVLPDRAQQGLRRGKISAR